jgi:hypothetical protein
MMSHESTRARKRQPVLVSCFRVFVAIGCCAALLLAQPDPVVGNWRGTLSSSAGTETPIIITIAKPGDVYIGSTNGLNAPSEIPLSRIAVDGTRVAIAASSESRLGDLVLTGELTVEGTAMKGSGALAVGAQKFPVTFALQRRPRAEVIQPKVEQRAGYFLGTWTFDYVGAEVPPLSAGSRTGTARFTSDAANFVTGLADVDTGSRKYQETVKIGFDPDTNMLVYTERRSDNFQLTSLGNWRSPIGISFVTSPVKADGKTFQLRRFIAVRSESAFDVTEEFSVDGGPFRRLGNARYTKAP